MATRYIGGVVMRYIIKTKSYFTPASAKPFYRFAAEKHHSYNGVSPLTTGLAADAQPPTRASAACRQRRAAMIIMTTVRPMLIRQHHCPAASPKTMSGDRRRWLVLELTMEPMPGFMPPCDAAIEHEGHEELAAMTPTPEQCGVDKRCANMPTRILPGAALYRQQSANTGMTSTRPLMRRQCRQQNGRARGYAYLRMPTKCQSPIDSREKISC